MKRFFLAKSVLLILLVLAGGCTDPQTILTSSFPAEEVFKKKIAKDHPLSPNRIVTLEATEFFSLGDKPWHLKTKNINWLKGRKKATLEGVEWTVKNPDNPNQIQAQLKCPHGTYFIKKNLITFDETVTISRGNETLTANRLQWDGNIQQFQGLDGVRWTKPEQTLKADRFYAPTDFSTINLEGNVQLTTSVDALKN